MTTTQKKQPAARNSADARRALPPNTFEGNIVSIASRKLVMICQRDKVAKEQSHTLATDAKTTLDGKDCKTEHLKAGMKIRVTTKASDTKVATRIEAIDKNRLFAATHDDKVVGVTNAKPVTTGKDSKRQSKADPADANASCDDTACDTSDLKPGIKTRCDD